MIRHKKPTQAKGDDWTALKVEEILADLVEVNVTDGMRFVVVTRNQLRKLATLALRKDASK